MEIDFSKFKLVLRARDRSFYRNDLGLRIVHRRLRRLVRRVSLSDGLPYLGIGGGQGGCQCSQSQTCIAIVDLCQNLSHS